MTLEEFDRLNRQGKAHACPICGKQYLSHCYHNGEEVNCMVEYVPKWKLGLAPGLAEQMFLRSFNIIQEARDASETSNT